MRARQLNDLHVVVYEDGELPGTWVAHCLDFDVMSQGISRQHAFHMIGEAIELVIAADLAEGLDPRTRAPAPLEDWPPFWHRP
jgi:predicted RNase H-like HicB family nuclease